MRKVFVSLLLAIVVAFYPLFSLMLLSNSAETHRFGSVRFFCRRPIQFIHNIYIQNGRVARKTMENEEKCVLKQPKKHTVQHNTTQQHKITCWMLVCIMLCSGFDMCLLAQLNSDGMTMICASSLTCMWLLQSKHAPVVRECVYSTCWRSHGTWHNE